MIYLETVGSTIGALQIGLALCLFLLGASTLQIFYYFEHYRKDKRFFKIFVSVVWLLEILHAIFMCHGVYTISITFFGSKKYISYSPWSIKLLLPLSALIDIAVECCFAYRIRLLSNQWKITIFCWCLIGIRLVTVSIAAVFSFQYEMRGLAIHYSFVFPLAFVPLAVVDLVISMSQLYWFSQIRKGIASNSSKLATKLSIFALECGLLALSLGIATLVTALCYPQSYIWLAILGVHSKVYSNALLFSLNRRQNIAEWYGAGLRSTRGLSAPPNNPTSPIRESRLFLERNSIAVSLSNPLKQEILQDPVRIKTNEGDSADGNDSIFEGLA